jgi:mono/diheme cytochrome c family protein
MSDFFSSGWSVFIAVATVVSLVACLALLVFASRRTKMADDNSTGHVFDGDLVEMNNPMPMWWVVLFVLTVIFAFVYVYAFPGLGSVAGSLGWTSRGELEADQARASREMAQVYAAYNGVPAETLSQDAKAMAIGQRLFINNCATCHGSDARGSKGFPNLTDNDWLHGGTAEKIEETITLGRTGVMPPMAAAVGTSTDIHNVAQYVPEPLEEPVRLDRRLFGQGQVRGLRRLPWRRRQGQPGPRRPQPERQRLAARLGRSGDRRDRQQRQDERDAGAARPPERRADPRPRELRVEPVASSPDRRALRPLR